MKHEQLNQPERTLGEQVEERIAEKLANLTPENRALLKKMLTN
jgi:hypothetical protein